MPRSVPDRPPSTRPPVGAVVVAAVFAAITQAVLLATGFLSLTADDAARVLRARRPLDLGVLLEPDVWLPLDRIAYSLALSVGGDPVWAPRVVVGLAGIGLAVAVTWLAWELSHDPLVTYATAAVVSIAPHRVVFSVSTMGEVLFLLPTVVGVVLLVRWLRDGDRSALHLAAVALAVATTTRYEAWFVAATVGLAVVVWWRDGRLRWTDVLWLGLLLGLFPTAWLVANATAAGPIDTLSITRQQAEVASLSLATAAENSAAWAFAVDLVWFPALLLGLALAWRWAVSGGWRRDLVVVAVVPLVLVTVATVLTGSVPLAAPWRLGGLWVLLVLPLAMLVAVRALDRGGWRRVAAVSLVLVSILGWVLRDARLAGTTDLTWDEVALARSLASDGRRTLVEVRPGDDFQYLDLYAASSSLDHLELTIGDDPYLLALLVRRLDAWEEVRPDLVELYAGERFDLEDPADARRVGCTYRTVLVRGDRVPVALLEAGGVVEATRAGWALVAPPDCQ